MDAGKRRKNEERPKSDHRLNRVVTIAHPPKQNNRIYNKYRSYLSEKNDKTIRESEITPHKRRYTFLFSVHCRLTSSRNRLKLRVLFIIP
jgi:hypothetical protein